MQSRDLSQMQWVIWVEVLETLEQVKQRTPWKNKFLKVLVLEVILSHGHSCQKVKRKSHDRKDYKLAFKVATLPDTFANYEGADLEWGDSDFSPSENFFNYPNIFDVYIEGFTCKTSREIFTHGM